ncbi:MAG: stage II sporulation protein D [Bacillota bacterium]
MHINWKRVFVLAGIAGFLILLLRGCVFACQDQQNIGDREEVQIQTGREITLYLHETGQRETLPLEQYLVGVVAAEMPASFHIEALKAQAVAARTYTLTRLNGGCSSGCDVCSDSTCCQAYDTDEACRKKWGSNYAANIQKIREAVIETGGEALYYDGKLIEALYHAASGGMTEDSENVFASARPYLRSVDSKNEVGSSHITDEERLTRKEFVKAVNATWPKAKLSADKLEDQVEIKERFESGRVESIRLGGVTATGRELRGALELRSANFTITYTKSDVIIDTRGYGHGVGMSQAGANGMAEDGATYQEILKHYYTGVEIEKINN